MMKGILLNQDMVRAILDGRKSVTRRVMKPQPIWSGCDMRWWWWRWPKFWWRDDWDPMETITEEYSIFKTGDILYVRETFCECCLTENYSKGHSNNCYKASVKSPVYGCKNCYTKETGCKWRPSIHMPKEAARIFLRVTGVRVERLQDITVEQAIAEGAKKQPCEEWVGERTECAYFANLWDSTIKKADLPLYGWEANPWVWVIEFERISREEAQKGGEGNG